MTTYLAFAAFGQYDVERGHSRVGPYVYAFEHGLGGRWQPRRSGRPDDAA